MTTSRESAPGADGAAHIVLLGDSIFDNSRYTERDPDVVTHVRLSLPKGARATLLAIDGSTTASMQPQVSEIPEDATHLVVSLGGNDALQHQDLLSLPARSTEHALQLFTERTERFETSYRYAVGPVFRRNIPVTLCTIYNGNFKDRARARLARVVLTMFNDVILRVGFEHHASIIDLRLICNDPHDYVDEIEPSGPGGLKIAKAIVEMIGMAPSGQHSIIHSRV